MSEEDKIKSFSEELKTLLEKYEIELVPRIRAEIAIEPKKKV